MKTNLLRACLASVSIGTAALAAGTFDCRSNGSDGALIFPADAGVITFDPTTFTPALDQDKDGVYQFTTVTIPTGTTVRCRADKAGWAPLYWLCQGDVVIDGTLDLDGEPGTDAPANTARLNVPGPGGFPGARGMNAAIGLPGDEAGFGPGDNRSCGQHPGGYFLSPLTGGSGGGRWYLNAATSGGGGGAGGGAILLASNTAIRLNGVLSCDGGPGGFPNDYWAVSYGGGGGAIRLLAPVVAGTGTISAAGGLSLRGSSGSAAYNDPGALGWVRIESTDWQFTGTATGRLRNVALLASTYLSLPGQSTSPTVRVARVNGVELPITAKGRFDVPDAVLNTQAPVTFDIAASNVPLGTTLTLYLWNETEDAITLESSPLAGTLLSSTATAVRTVPHGLTRGQIFATFTQP